MNKSYSIELSFDHMTGIELYSSFGT